MTIKSNGVYLLCSLGSDSIYIIKHLDVIKSTDISEYKSKLKPYFVFIYSAIVWLNEIRVDKNKTVQSRFYSFLNYYMAFAIYFVLPVPTADVIKDVCEFNNSHLRYLLFYVATLY